jgi:hypothetical protein
MKLFAKLKIVEEAWERTIIEDEYVPVLVHPERNVEGRRVAALSLTNYLETV